MLTLHQLLHGSLKQRINGLFIKSMGSQIIPVGTETSIVEDFGFVVLFPLPPDITVFIHPNIVFHFHRLCNEKITLI